MPYNSFKILRDLVIKIRMGDVNDTPEIIISDQNQKTITVQPSGEDGNTNGTELLSPLRCNGYGTGHSIPSTDHPPHQNSLPPNATKRQGSNGSAHFISRDGDHNKPLDTTVNFNFDPSKDTDDKKEDLSSKKNKRFPRISLRAAFSHRDKKRKCLDVTKKFISSPFGVLCLILAYLSLGACVFMWMERAEESKRRTDLIGRRYDLTKRLVNCTEMNLDPTECLVTTVKKWEQELVLNFPVLYIHLGDDNSTTPRIWNWPNAFYGCFSVITTIGYGTIAPITKFGRMFVIVYAIVGIPLMLLLVADIGGQLARLVKIIIIAIRKRRERAEFCNQSPKKDGSAQKESPPTVSIQEPDDQESPSARIRRETFELKGQVNQGLDMEEEDIYDNHAKVAHLNGVNLHLEVAGTHHDSDSSYSSCDNGSINGSIARRRKRKTYFKKKTPMQSSSADVSTKPGGVGVNNCDCRQDQSCKDCIGRDQGHHGITIQIDCDESVDNCDNNTSEKSNGDEKTLNGIESEHRSPPTYSQLYDAVKLSDNEREHSDHNNELPPTSAEHQIKDYDSISQCCDHYHGDNTPGVTLDVPKFRSTLVSSPEDQSSANDEGIASSIGSSVHTTASTAPTEIYKSDLEGSPCQKRSNKNKTVDPQLPMIRIDEASDSSSSRGRSPSASPQISRRRRHHHHRSRDRRLSQISSVSINLACLEPRDIDIPSEYSDRAASYRKRQRRRGVKFGAALGSFSSVSENDIAVFSIPLWVALLLLFIYLFIGAFCYSAMEDWAFIDSFYYAFISLSTIGFGDLYFVPERFEGSLIFNFIYCFIGLSFVSMVWGLSSREFTLFARKLAKKLGYYKSRRWRQSVRGWTSRIRQRSLKRWSSRRRNAVKVPQETDNGQESDISPHSSSDEAPAPAPHLSPHSAGHAES
ncbi:uncharacterized protein [Amphiura filiformis]|uniref:uncharacterized protein n=1 Tax=Amphiura filiformis TaxID=82378 RepID=UPI003B219BE7